MWVMLNYLHVPESWSGVFFCYEIVKYGNLKSVKGYQKAFAEMDFKNLCHFGNISSPVETSQCL
jgi:hypothetical protein